MISCGCGHTPRLHAPTCAYLGCDCAGYQWQQWQDEAGWSVVLLLSVGILWGEYGVVDWVLSLAGV